MTITCDNRPLDWSAKITKVDGVDSQKLLEGAVFGLYSPVEADRISAENLPERYEDLDISETITFGAETWYLMGVQTSDEQGEITWEDLIRPRYYLLEVKAPDGYKLNDPAGLLLTRADAEQGICIKEVENFVGVLLPETGGAGTFPYAIGGLLFMLTAAGGLMYRTKKSKERERELR